jgi:hypothetical protein|tara:strand:+ start:1246 stop:1512 length:267 start_codon:yes stop_codon:yes gene_type:complete
MITKILSAIWNFSLKKGWDWVWSKTTVDEKAIAVVKETKRRAKRVSEEISDVGQELKEAAIQSKDIVSAAAGKKRKGRPAGSKNKTKK